MYITFAEEIFSRHVSRRHNALTEVLRI